MRVQLKNVGFGAKPGATSNGKIFSMRHASPGFTLLELIVTTTLLSLILVMVLGALRLGSASWERGGERAEKYQRRRVVLDLLSRQLKSSFPYKVKAQKAEADYLVYVGEPGTLKFVSSFSIKARKPEGFVYVIYRVVDRGPSHRTLALFEKRILRTDFMEETPGDEQFVTLIDDLADLTFEYFQEGEEEEEPGEWLTSWEGKDKKILPRQVRLTATWREKRRGEDVQVVLPTLIPIPAYRFEDRKTPPTRLRRPSPFRRG